MDIELDPPTGITGFPLGMPAQAVKAAAAELGRVHVTDEGAASQFRHMKVQAVHPQFTIVFHLEDGKTLTAAEVWAPAPGPDEITVNFRGIDVFRTPARELVGRLAEIGLDALNDEPSSWTFPRLSLGFTHDLSGDDVEMDTDGEPLYFQAVLTGPTNYYDFLLDDEE